MEVAPAHLCLGRASRCALQFCWRLLAHYSLALPPPCPLQPASSLALKFQMCVRQQGYCAGRAAGRGIRQHTTGVSFGAHGDRVVAIYHADHVYAFDITGSSASASAKGERYPFTSELGCSAQARSLGDAEEGSHSGASLAPMDTETASSM